MIEINLLTEECQKIVQLLSYCRVDIGQVSKFSTIHLFVSIDFSKMGAFEIF